MFTGIIERLGHLASRQQAEGGVRLVIEPDLSLSAYEAIATGESISVSGVCLTLEPGSTPRRLIFFLSGETLSRTTLGTAQIGGAVNLERAFRVGDRIGGHFVQGHVDAVGIIRRWEQQGEAAELEVSSPPELAPLIAPKGSIAVDGISLTIVEARGDSFTVAIIPQTIAATTLRAARPGMPVNIEADVLARYVQRAILGAEPASRTGITSAKLREAGF